MTKQSKTRGKASPPFAKLVADHRTASGLSYREAEDASGVDKASIHRIEMGNPPNLPNFARLCRWIGIDANKAISEFAG